MNYKLAVLVFMAFLVACSNDGAGGGEAVLNSPPHATSQSLSMNEDTQIAINLSAKDNENDPLTYEVIDLPSRGSLGGSPPNVTYSPEAGYSGTDNFSFKANDGDLDSNVATIVVEVRPVNTGPVTTAFITPLNDTGVILGSNYPNGNNVSCIGEVISQQDCSHGRDAIYADDSDGHAGFSYTKLDSNGNMLPALATEWSCVKDNVTGLIWEVKQGGDNIMANEGLHDADDTFSWYSSDIDTNGGNVGFDNSDQATCFGYDINNPGSYCNTEAFVLRINSVGMCSANNWRAPTKAELRSIVNLSQQNPAIDMTYFPNTKSDLYWSSSPMASYEYGAWYISFRDGSAITLTRSRDLHARLVHSVE